MAGVYIIYSKNIDSFYVGSTIDFTQRLQEHNNGKYDCAFTARANDWVLFYIIKGLDQKQARKVEAHIKKMKSRTYYKNLKQYPEIAERLIKKYL